jgi:hypothetical protein
MPRETVAFFLCLGVGLGILWGGLSLQLWAADTRVPGIVIGPLWILAVIGPPLHGDVYVLGGAICVTLGLVAGSLLLAIARARGA